MSVLKIAISTARPTTTLTTTFETATGPHAITNRIINYLTAVMSGSESAFSATVPPSINIKIQENEIAATGAFTFSNAPASGTTVYVNGVPFVAVGSGGPTGNIFATGVGATGAAFNLVAAINASTSNLVSGYVTAATGIVAASGVCKITSVFYGLAGNQTLISKGVDGNSVVTVSAATLANGTNDPTAQTLTF